MIFIASILGRYDVWGIIYLVVSSHVGFLDYLDI